MSTATASILAPVASLTLPDSAALTTSAQRALAFIEAYTITSPDDYELAADELRAIKTRATALEAQRTGITGPINKALKAINDLFRGPAELLDLAETTLKRKMLAWDAEQARLAAEQRRIAEEAAAAERRRLEEIAIANAAQAKRLAEEAERAAAEGNAQAASVAAAAAQRAQAEASTAATTAQLVVATPPAIDKPKVAGISTSKKIDFKVANLAALIQYIATGDTEDKPLAHPELLALLMADDVRLRAYVRGLGLSCNLPGVIVSEQSVMAARKA